MDVELNIGTMFLAWLGVLVVALSTKGGVRLAFVGILIVVTLAMFAMVKDGGLG